MKLHTKSLQFLSLALLGIMTVWAVIFYLGLLDEVYDSLDDGLDNSRQLIIQRAQEDSTVLTRNELRESNYIIREISGESALSQKDKYSDTLMYMQNEDDLEPVRMLTTAFELKGRFYSLQIITSMVEEDDLIESFLWGLGSLYLALLAVIFLINNVLLRKLWQPFYAVLHQLKTYRVGKDTLPAPVETGISEFRELKSSADQLFQQILSTFSNQKQFTENAAHELQTPLAASINKLEILLEGQDLTEEQVTELAGVIDSLQRLTRFNRSLLLLSRIENRQYLKSEEVHLDEIVKEAIDNISDFADHKKIYFEVKADAELIVNIHPDLARILISNLIKNAVVHNKIGGKVIIELQPAEILICNTGSNKPLDQERIFQRFFKETTSAGNTGLGLAIVKAITDLYGIGITYDFQGMHCMRLSFS